MQQLVKKRTSVSAGEFPKLVKANWPLGQITVCDDRFVLDAVSEKFTLLFTDVDYVDILPGQVNFYHHNTDVPKDIGVNGLFIARILRKAIGELGLPVRVK